MAAYNKAKSEGVVMAVQFADKALYEWLESEIASKYEALAKWRGKNSEVESELMGELHALNNCKDKLEQFWGGEIEE